MLAAVTNPPISTLGNVNPGFWFQTKTSLPVQVTLTKENNARLTNKVYVENALQSVIFTSPLGVLYHEIYFEESLLIVLPVAKKTPAVYRHTLLVLDPTV